VARDWPRRPDQDAGVEQAPLFAPLQEPDDGPGAEAAAVGRERLGGRPGDGLGVRPGLVLALEAVAGQGALGEDDQPGALARGVVKAAAEGAEVVVPVGEAAVHLHGGDRPLGHGSSPVAASGFGPVSFCYEGCGPERQRPGRRLRPGEGATPSERSHSWPWWPYSPLPEPNVASTASWCSISCGGPWHCTRPSFM